LTVDCICQYLRLNDNNVILVSAVHPKFNFDYLRNKEVKLGSVSLRLISGYNYNFQYKHSVQYSRAERAVIAQSV